MNPERREQILQFLAHFNSTGQPLFGIAPPTAEEIAAATGSGITPGSTIPPGGVPTPPPPPPAGAGSPMAPPLGGLRASDITGATPGPNGPPAPGNLLPPGAPLGVASGAIQEALSGNPAAGRFEQTFGRNPVTGQPSDDTATVAPGTVRSLWSQALADERERAGGDPRQFRMPWESHPQAHVFERFQGMTQPGRPQPGGSMPMHRMPGGGMMPGATHPGPSPRGPMPPQFSSPLAQMAIQPAIPGARPPMPRPMQDSFSRGMPPPRPSFAPSAPSSYSPPSTSSRPPIDPETFDPFSY